MTAISALETLLSDFLDSFWKKNSAKFAMMEFSEVVAPASQLCYLVSKRSGGERVGEREV